MPPSRANTRLSLGILAALVALIALIVVGPFLVVRSVIEQVESASDLVAHTRDVEVEVQALLNDLRNHEAATLAHALGHASANIRQRAATTSRRIPERIRRLSVLTRDNPEQLVRLGRLQSMADQRLRVSQRILAAPLGHPPREDIRLLLESSQIRGIGDQIVATEQSLLAARSTRERQLEKRSTQVRWIAMIAQLVLLAAGAIALRWLLESRRASEGRALRASERAQAVLQTVREPIVVLDNTQHVVMHNLAFAEIFALGSNNVTGKPLQELGQGTWRARDVQQRLNDVLARGRELWDYELGHQDETGRARALLINARRMALPDSADDVILVTANDVTALKLAEQQVRDLNRQLLGKVDQVSEVNRELEAFSYSVSHDLRAPLRHIGGFADKLSRHLGERNDEKTTHYLNTISTSARRMSQLIDDLLVYSRLGRSAMRLQAVDLQSVVDETRALLDANAAQDHPGHSIDWQIAPLPILVGDENMLRQVWLNLLSNAVKYSAGSEPARIRVSYRRDDNGDYLFEIADNGVGFDMAYAGKLFGVFQRLHSISEFEGTGIGLASVRRVLARHGGRVWAEASPGEGARFYFTLPANGDTLTPGLPA